MSALMTPGTVLAVVAGILAAAVTDVWGGLCVAALIITFFAWVRRRQHQAMRAQHDRAAEAHGVWDPSLPLLLWLAGGAVSSSPSGPSEHSGWGHGGGHDSGGSGGGGD